MATKNGQPTQRPNLDNTFYVDCNRINSVNSEESNASWTYQMNQGIHLPQGTQVGIQQVFLNSQGILGGSIEIPEDVTETMNFGYYVPQGSYPVIPPIPTEELNNGSYPSPIKEDPGGQGGDTPQQVPYSSAQTDGNAWSDALQHRNIVMSEGSPLLELVVGASDNPINDDVNYKLNGNNTDPRLAPQSFTRYDGSSATERTVLRAQIARLSLLQDLGTNKDNYPRTEVYQHYNGKFSDVNEPDNTVTVLKFGHPAAYDLPNDTGTTARGGSGSSSQTLPIDRMVGVSINSGGTGYAVRDLITFTGGAFSAGSQNNQARCMVTEVSGSGAVTKIEMVYLGDKYSSTPTGLSGGSGTGLSLTPKMGRVVSTRTNGTGLGMTIGIFTNESFVVLGCICESGRGYRHNDVIFADISDNQQFNDFERNGTLGGPIYPQYHDLPVLDATSSSFDTAELSIQIKFSNSPLDIPQPATLQSLDTGEFIYYNTCSGLLQNAVEDKVYDDTITDQLYFSMNTNPNRSNATCVWGGQLSVTPFGRTILLRSSDERQAIMLDPTTQANLMTREVGYDIVLSKLNVGNPKSAPLVKGANYKEIPTVTYTPTAFCEESLNSSSHGQGFFCRMGLDGSSCQVEEVIYIPGTDNNLADGNYLAGQLPPYLADKDGQRTVPDDTNIKAKYTYLPPGILEISGGSPSVDYTQSVPEIKKAQASFVHQSFGNPSRPQYLLRQYSNVGPLPSPDHIFIVDPGTRFTFAVNDLCDLIPAPDGYVKGNGTNGQLRVSSIGTGVTGPGRPVVLGTAPGGVGYRQGENYMLRPVGQTWTTGGPIIYIRKITFTENYPTQTDNKASTRQLFQPKYNYENFDQSSSGARSFEVKKGITIGLTGQISDEGISQALFKGNSNTTQGDALGAPKSSIYRHYPNKYQAFFGSLLGLDSLRAAGGTNDPLGMVEVTADGKMKPVIGSATITVEKGVYGITELAEKITNQLASSSTRQGFLEDSALTLKTEFHNFEPAMMNNSQMNLSGKHIFVPVTVYNDLMAAAKVETEASPYTVNNDYYWDNYKFLGTYSFLKSRMGLQKKIQNLCPTTHGQQGGNGIVQWPGPTYSAIDAPADATDQPVSQTLQYNTTSNGTMIGTADFILSFDQTKSTFKMDYLHTPMRTPEYDAYGNQFPNPGTIGAYLKKISNNTALRGMLNQYNQWSQKGAQLTTPPNLINALENPLERISGIMVYNFGFQTSQKEGTIAGNNFGKFEDFFTDDTARKNAWSKTLWSKLGFTYSQLNDDSSKELVKYYNNPDGLRDPGGVLYGITTKMALDASAITSVSSVNYFTPSGGAPVDPTTGKPIGTGGSGNKNIIKYNPGQGPTQKISNISFPNQPSVSIYQVSNVQCDGPAIGAKPVVTLQHLFSPQTYAGSLYDGCNTYFIETTCESITAGDLPVLSRNGYFIITSDIVPTWRDSIKKGEPLPILGIVSKSNWESQDFINRTSDIVHTINQPKTINSVQIKVLNPDLTEPLLRSDSSVILRITLPPSSGEGFEPLVIPPKKD